MILGNHRDAWTFGAVDPNSGTAVLLEVSEASSFKSTCMEKVCKWFHYLETSVDCTKAR